MKKVSENEEAPDALPPKSEKGIFKPYFSPNVDRNVLTGKLVRGIVILSRRTQHHMTGFAVIPSPTSPPGNNCPEQLSALRPFYYLPP
jgi:hypothetical protein